MIPASEEHRDANGSFKIVRGLFLTQYVDVKQVVAKINVKCDRVCQQETKSRAKINRKPVIISEVRREIGRAHV